jgi:hypothetical protein
MQYEDRGRAPAKSSKNVFHIQLTIGFRQGYQPLFE